MALPFQWWEIWQVRTDPADGVEYRYVWPERDPNLVKSGWLRNEFGILLPIAEANPPDFSLVTDAKVGDVRIDKYTWVEFRFNWTAWVTTYPTSTVVGKYDKIRFNQILGK